MTADSAGVLLARALEVADKGWPTLPLNTRLDSGACSCARGAKCASAGKHPRIIGWQAKASTDPAQIKAWWRKWPAAEVGVALPIGVVAADVDYPDRLDGFALPDGPRPPSRRGFHALMAHIGDLPGKLPNDAGEWRVGGKHLLRVYDAAAWPYREEVLPPVPAWALATARPSDESPPDQETDAAPMTSRNELLGLAGRMKEAGFGYDARLAELRSRYRDGRITESDPARTWTDDDFTAIAKNPPWSAPLPPMPIRFRSAADVPAAVPPAEPTPPMLAGWAYQGLVGELVDLVMPTTEGDPAAIALAFLTWFGTAVGRGPYTMVGSTRHHANLSTVVVGDTSKARKGITSAVIRGVLDPIEHVPTASASTGEGIIWAVRDARQEWDRKAGQLVIADPGASDKRLLLLEPEFGRLLTVMARPGNTLSAILRDAWDGSPLSVAVKGEGGGYRATAAHIGVLGNITREELAQLLTQADAVSGFGNRFLWSHVRRRRSLPLPPALDDARTRAFQTRLVRLLADIAERGHFALDLEDRAKEVWIEAYETISESAGPGLVGKLTDRTEAQARRLALVFALLAGSEWIMEPHLRGAFAVVSNSIQTVRFIAGGLGARPDENKVLAFLRGAPEGRAYRKAVLHECFSGHKSPSELDQLRDRLVAGGLLTTEAAVTNGPPAEVWVLR